MKTFKKEIKPFLKKAGLLKYVHRFKGFRHRLTARKNLVKIPLNKIRCQKRPFSEQQGFSGKPIASFPPARFFKMSLDDYDKAYEAFCDWFRECLVEMKAWQIPEADGGWAGGSFVRAVYKLHEEHGKPLTDFEYADQNLVDEVIAQQVKHYLGVVKSIRKKGFDDLIYPPIYCESENGYYYLENGHHRVSSLWALGYDDVAVMLINN